MKRKTLSFSYKTQSFYDQSLNYAELPEDLVEVTEEQHLKLLNAINEGSIILDDLSFSAPKPSQFHIWNGTAWLDNRTEKEIAEYKRSLLPPLTKRQFSLYLFDSGKYDQVMDALNANLRFKIEFDTVANIERSSSTVLAMSQILEWDDSMIDEEWKKALKL